MESKADHKIIANDPSKTQYHVSSKTKTQYYEKENISILGY